MAINRVQPDTALGTDIVTNVITGAVGPTLRKKKQRIQVYAALISQVDADAPTVYQLLQNDFGVDVVWTRAGTGSYRGTITATEVIIKDGYTAVETAGIVGFSLGEWFNDNVVRLQTYNVAGANADSMLQANLVKIYVYNI